MVIHLRITYFLIIGISQLNWSGQLAFSKRFIDIIPCLKSHRMSNELSRLKCTYTQLGVLLHINKTHQNTYIDKWVLYLEWMPLCSGHLNSSIVFPYITRLVIHRATIDSPPVLIRNSNMKVLVIFTLAAAVGVLATPIAKIPLIEEQSGKFEGDILLTPDQESSLINKRTGLIDTRYRWTYNIVPYTLENVMTEAQKEAVREALAEMESSLCLNFIERTTEVDYVRVTVTDSGCYSYVGRIGGAQQLNLQSYEPGTGCFRKGTIIHEFMHALGFYHMQSATERDEYVRIVWENIQAGTESNFNTYDANRINQFQVPYDYGSVMHYSSTAFSINGEDTIVPLLLEEGKVMGQREGMAESDIRRINNMYC